MKAYLGVSQDEDESCPEASIFNDSYCKHRL
jgi:hypothetical protein